MKLIPPKVVLNLLLISFILVSLANVQKLDVSAQPAWPQPWIQIDWDRNENGPGDDWRDVEYAYYQYDQDYLYLKLQCYYIPGSKWPSRDGRYKWFIDLDGTIYYSGGNVYDAEYLVFVEDTDHDGAGEMYLVFDMNNDNSFGEYEPWPPVDYADYRITDVNVGGWRIVAPYQIEMYISWASIGTPSSYGLFWSTDQQNPNLDQSPTTDRIDEEQVILLRNVAAVSQTPSPTTVSQGENVSIDVVIENPGTQAETFNVTCYFNNTEIGTKLVTDLAAAGQTTVTFNWDTAGLPVGNYTITAWADSSAVITETNETDNWCTSPAIVTVQPAPVHDVAAVSQVPDQTSVVNGTIVNINVTVSNLGDFVETFNVTCFYDSNPIDYYTVTTLAPQTSISIIFPWNTTGVASSTYHIRSFADSSRAITEIDENNNNCTRSEVVTVYSSSDKGKLSIEKAKTNVITGEDPPVVGLPTVYELTILVANTGGSDVSNIEVNETISPDVSLVSVGTPSKGNATVLPPPKIVWDVGTLAPGADATLTLIVSVTPASPTLTYLNHKEDTTASGTDTLSGELVSDVADTDVTVIAIMRDVAAISQVPTSTTVNQGETIAIEVTVKNFGNVSETFDTSCYYDSNLLGVIRIYSLEAGGQRVISFAWDTTGIPTGTYSITAEADSSYELTESNETNNICTSPATVQIVIHDIAVVSQVPSPTAVTQGEIVTITVVVKNEGTEIETFDVSCYLNETLIETKTVEDLAPNSTATLSFLWNTTGAPAGEYFINTAASTVPGERDTDDNACLSTTSVTVFPLQYQITVTASPSEALGGTFYVTYTQNATTYTNAMKSTPWVEWVDATTVVTVNAPQDIISVSPNKRYRFSSFYPASSVTMNQDRNITLLYTTQHLLTVLTDPADLTPKPTRNPIGEVESTNSWWYDKSTSVQLTAQHVGGYGFREWTIDNIPQGDGDRTILVIMDARHIAIAHYRTATVGGYTVSIKSPFLLLWMSLNVTLILATFITAFLMRKRQRKNS